VFVGLLVGLFVFNLGVKWYEARERHAQEEKEEGIRQAERDAQNFLAHLRLVEANWGLILARAKCEESNRDLRFRIQSQPEYQERLKEIGKDRMRREELEVLEHEEWQQKLRRMGNRNWSSDDAEWLRAVSQRVCVLREDGRYDY
jgi:hypothetical protein